MDAVSEGFLPDIIGDYPNLKEIFSDIIDKDFEYGGETKIYPSNPKTSWQADLRTMPNGKLLSKGDPMTEHEYSNHNQRTRAKFQSMINNKGVIADEFKTKEVCAKASS